MNKLTKISIIPMRIGDRGNCILASDLYASKVCNEIKSEEAEGWYLRGTPEFLECYMALMLTFEKEEPADDLPEEQKQTEPDVPPMTKEDFARLIGK